MVDKSYNIMLYYRQFRNEQKNKEKFSYKQSQ